MTVPAGERRELVSIQQRTEASDGHDGLDESWPTLYSRWKARITPVGTAIRTARDVNRAGAVDPRVTHEVVFAWWPTWRADLAGGRARLVWHPSDVAGDVVLDIVGSPFEMDGKRENVIVLVKELA